MELVDDKKLEAVAKFIGEMEVEGNCVCDDFNEALKENRIDVPCDAGIGSCKRNCQFYSKENFLKWIKPDEKQGANLLERNRPKRIDFLRYNNISNNFLNKYDHIPNFLNKDGYITALEKYCDSLELYIKCKDGYLKESNLKNKELAEKLEKIRGVLDGSH
ncbi:hypothetical protein [Catenibacterium sp.]|uniref:hypothetical protein n=1 Tax=Catenibacterium sp. TaxID=2049022 RepID=UPI004027BE6D